MASTEAGPGVRFRLPHLMLAVAACAAFFALARGTGWVVSVLLIPTGIGLALALTYGLPARDRAQRAGLRFVLLAIALNAVVFFQGLSEFGVVGLIVMLQTSLLVAGVVCVAYASWLTALGDRRTGRVQGWLRLGVLAAAIVLPFVATLTHLPLRVAVLVSRSAIDKLADEVATGEEVRFPRHAGLVPVVEGVVDRRTGNVGLVLDRSPSGRTGLVRPAPNVSSTAGPFGNRTLDLDLGGGWRLQVED
jgi:hypothetical protein